MAGRRPAAAGLRARPRADRARAATTASALVPLCRTAPACSALLGATALAAVLANLLNNVPALLVLLPAAAAAGPPTVLAVLIGVNCGPNLTYTGSLATLLWRRVLRDRDAEPSRTRIPPARRIDGASDPDCRYGRAVAGDLKVLAWITEGGWEACVDAAAALPARPGHAPAREHGRSSPARAGAATRPCSAAWARSPGRPRKRCSRTRRSGSARDATLHARAASPRRS